MNVNPEEYLARINETNAFMLHNQIHAVEVGEDYAIAVASLSDDSNNMMGTVHGSLMMTLAEVAAGTAARNDGRRYVAVDAGFRFISSSKGRSQLVGRAHIVKRGGTMCFTHAEVYQGERLLLAGEVTFFCLKD